MTKIKLKKCIKSLDSDFAACVLASFPSGEKSVAQYQCFVSDG